MSISTRFRLLAVTRATEIEVYNLDTGALLTITGHHKDDGLLYATFVHDGGSLVGAYNDGRIRAWDMDQEDRLYGKVFTLQPPGKCKIIRLQGKVRSICSLDPNERALAVAVCVQLLRNLALDSILMDFSIITTVKKIVLLSQQFMRSRLLFGALRVIGESVPSYNMPLPFCIP